MNDPDPWEIVQNAIYEIEWFALRRVNLSAYVSDVSQTWAEMLLQDIAVLREAILEARRNDDEIHYQTRIEEATHLRKAADLLFGDGAWNQIISLHKALVHQARQEVSR